MSTYTFATIVIPGHVSLGKFKKILSKFGTAYGIVKSQQTRPNSYSGLPHAFTQFDTSLPCANDSSRNERTLELKKDTRRNIAEIRALRIQTTDTPEPLES